MIIDRKMKGLEKKMSLELNLSVKYHLLIIEKLMIHILFNLEYFHILVTKSKDDS